MTIESAFASEKRKWTLEINLSLRENDVYNLQVVAMKPTHIETNMDLPFDNQPSLVSEFCHVLLFS